MGIDVSLEDIKKLTPRFTVSLDSYIIQTKSCTFLGFNELAQSFPSSTIK